MVSNERFAQNLSIAARYDQKVENFPVLLVGESKNPEKKLAKIQEKKANTRGTSCIRLPPKKNFFRRKFLRLIEEVPLVLAPPPSKSMGSYFVKI